MGIDDWGMFFPIEYEIKNVNLFGINCILIALTAVKKVVAREGKNSKNCVGGGVCVCVCVAIYPDLFL